MASITIYSVAEAAEELGRHPSYIRRLCAQHDIGERKSERFRVLTEADLERLRGLVRKPGNPEFGAGYKAQKKKRRKKSATKVSKK